jgi:hypothetical protein
MNITGGYVQCLVLRLAVDQQGNRYRDFQRHEWNIGQTAKPIDTSIQNFNGTWSITGNGWVGTRSWSMSASMVPVPFTVRIESDGLVHLRRGTSAITGGTLTDSATPNQTPPAQAPEHAWIGPGLANNGLTWDPNLTAKSINNGWRYINLLRSTRSFQFGLFTRVGAFVDKDIDNNSAHAQPQMSVSNTAWWHFEVYF